MAADAGPSVRRVVIERIRPSVDGGRFPAKRTAGDQVEVRADIFADGHDVIMAILRDRPRTTTIPPPLDKARDASSDVERVTREEWRETAMALAAPGTDEWTARFDVPHLGYHEFSIVAWVDPFLSWRRDLELKAKAGQDVSLELSEGALLVGDAARVSTKRQWLQARAAALTESSPLDRRVMLALDEELAAEMARSADRSAATVSDPLCIWVDRERARFSAWYEMFPRSAGPDPARSATFRETSTRLPAIADLGFDVLYLPPIHPIGTSFRKGRNNSLVPAPDDPGSPWAIGSASGGHTAVEPGLGTLADFEAFRAETERLGLEIALDLAWQCSPDHPWVREHPEWFRHRPDGTIKYAENPPKKYQDIYPFDFTCADWRGLWNALLSVVRFWVDRGVRIFRVDNPHTKTFGFWEWSIAQIHAQDPGVIFLSEAFTRPKIMRYLAKIGFTQSYTYFTWRNTKAELTEYFTELTGPEIREYFRPNLFTNTPDILHAYLQDGGRPAFEARLLLAATLGASYGIYSGFELCEGRAVSGTEEYVDSEKYQFRQWDWDRPGNIKELVARVNRIRREERALQDDWTLRFHATDNPQVIAYSKSAVPGPSSGPAATLLMVINVDPHHLQHGFVHIPRDVLGAAHEGTFAVHDLLDDTSYAWRGEWNYVRLEPGVRQGHILKIGGKPVS